ncbi:MAG: sugar MFS transporter [Bacteroidia bacterium]
MTSTQTQKSNLLPIIIMGAFYFIFGFATWLNGTLIPYLKIACELNDFQSYLVATAFYISYFVMALPSSWVLKKTGLKNGMMLGLFVMAVGALVFVPAANTRTYSIFLLGLFIIGTGLSLLQTAANPYVSILGPIDSAAKRISIMGICNKVAGTLAPLILGAIILSDADILTEQLKTMDAVSKVAKLNELASRVITPYTIMAIILVGLAMLVKFSGLPDIETESEREEETVSNKTSVFQFSNLTFGLIALFLYVGVEVISIDTLTNFGTSLGMPLSKAKYLPSYTLGAMTIGYIISILTIPKIVKQEVVLAVSAVLGVVLAFGAIATPGIAAIGFIALLGFANAVMWPAIFPLAIHATGKYLKTASALLIMCIVGGAILTPLYGGLAGVKEIGTQNAYCIMVPCYLYILWYAVAGHKVNVKA